MTIARVYTMHAKEGLSGEMEAALNRLIDGVTAIDGSHGAELLRDAGNDRRFILIEKWESIEAHKAGTEAFKKIDMSALMAAIDGPPDSAYFDYLVRQ
jgi:quinol monooxygenase YgiN